MTKKVVELLERFCEENKEKYSSKTRSFNTAQETFLSYEIYPLSESTAAVIYLKDTGKRAAFFCYWIRSSNEDGGFWQYFVPTDSHILGMESFPEYKRKVEVLNYKAGADGKGGGE